MEFNTDFKSGFAVMAGLANAGKSTLLNKFAGVDLSPVTHKPQTTRQNILAISEGEGHQIVFVDTPGFLHAEYKLQQIMLNSLDQAINEDADLVLFVYDATAPLSKHLPLIKKLKNLYCPILLVINKIDLVKDKAELDKIENTLKGEIDFKDVFRVNAKEGVGVSELEAATLSYMPPSPPYFPQGQLTDRWERFYIAEFIREQIFLLYGQEVPYATFVEVEKFTEDLGDKNFIRAIIHVERQSQKPIIIGKGGAAIAKLRKSAQARIVDFLQQKYRLELQVMVTPNWRGNTKNLRQFGFLD
ncbi:MAG: GTPase Era [Elusimicrobiota bacterium]|jgi:GTP-binding protein Era|nr:GTPase Era [Elusimicrobiota bacterium]